MNFPLIIKLLILVILSLSINVIYILYILYINTKKHNIKQSLGKDVYRINKWPS